MKDHVVKWTKAKAKEGGKDESEGSDKEDKVKSSVIPRG